MQDINILNISECEFEQLHFIGLNSNQNCQFQFLLGGMCVLIKSAAYPTPRNPSPTPVAYFPSFPAQSPANPAQSPVFPAQSPAHAVQSPTSAQFPSFPAQSPAPNAKNPAENLGFLSQNPAYPAQRHSAVKHKRSFKMPEFESFGTEKTEVPR